jgi:serine phosphatase RsbU (regulator of sigma subunit)
VRSPRVIVIAACGALALSGGVWTGVALGSASSSGLPTVSVPALTVPTLTVPKVTVPKVTVPTVTVPTVTVPSATVPSITTGPLTTPQVSTPSLTTPSVGTPSLPKAPVKTPTLPTLSTLTNVASTPSHDPGSSSTASAPTATQAAATPGSSGSGSSASSTSGRGRGTAASTGHGGSSAAVSATGSGRRTASGPGGGAGTAAAAAGSGSGNARSGSTAASAPASTGAAPARKSSGPIARLVKVLPTAVLFALLAFAVIAAVMALNAYLQRRRAKSLAGQRAALLSDVGVLQAALLPAVPASLGELEVSVAYRPAQGLAAGGDFFDVFTVSPERTGIIIGDVSGHGRESLIHAALVRYTLRTLMGEGHPLPDVLSRADRYLSGELGDGYATVVICRYEHTTGEFTWAKAGHEPPIIAGQPDRDEEAAVPLGLGMGDTWPQFSRFLAPGERVCLFTDGLTEARRHGDQLGRAHLKSLVEQRLGAQALLDRIEAEADECTDDLAAVVITRAVVVGDTVGDARAQREAAAV